MESGGRGLLLGTPPRPRSEVLDLRTRVGEIYTDPTLTDTSTVQPISPTAGAGGSTQHGDLSPRKSLDSDPVPTQPDTVTRPQTQTHSDAVFSSTRQQCPWAPQLCTHGSWGTGERQRHCISLVSNCLQPAPDDKAQDILLSWVPQVPTLRGVGDQGATETCQNCLSLFPPSTVGS